MTKYTCTEYDTQATLDAAIIGMATTVTFDIIPYREGGQLKFMIVSPHPSKGT
jgi:hypothetical protein